MLVKLSDETVALLGATDPKDCLSRIQSLITDNATLTQSMSEQTTNFENRIKAIEDGLNQLRSGLAATITDTVKASLGDWASSEAGKKLIGAEASRITLEALASVGTTPAKPSPIPSQSENPRAAADALEAQGKFEEAFALLPTAEKSQHMGAKAYAAFKRAEARGQIRIK